MHASAEIRLRSTRIKHDSRPWIDGSIVRLSSKKKKIRKQLRNRPGDIALVHDLAFVEQQLLERKRMLKERFLKRQFDEVSGDSRSCWKGLNLLLGRKDNRTMPSRVMKCDGSGVATCDADIADEFNTFFTQPGSSQPPDGHLSRTWTSRTIHMEDVDQEEVEVLLRQLDVRKATGPDGISNYTLKACAPELAPMISLCINKCMQSGTFPDVLKVACVTPIYKSGSKELLSNYRAISVLSAINKIFEQLIATRLTDFLKSTDFVYKHQYGFRKKSGTATAVIEALDFVHENLDNRDTKVVSALSLDLKRAFDSVNHRLLLDKLYAAGLRGRAYDLLADYLRDRAICDSVTC